ncbi:MAG: GTP cyclohydrolase I FolE [Flavobacteriaceae bacterium]|nr:GTP cyclohydrolase I FolE [Flavobacteriaceae bacterium]
MKKELLEILEQGDSHYSENLETPFNDNPQKYTQSEKVELIQSKVKDILEILGLDTNDQSISGTPYRVAKMWVNELFYGLSHDRKPSVSKFDKSYDYQEMIIEKNITVYSTCEHHLLPIVGKAHLAYFSKKQVLGLSKINRLVDFYAKRPQVQERLTTQIANEIKKTLNTKDVACLIEAKHLCVNSRGIKDINSSTITSQFYGAFKEQDKKVEFLQAISLETEF